MNHQTRYQFPVGTDFSIPQLYDLQFTYVDNGQVYSEIVILTDAEWESLGEAIHILHDARVIAGPDGDSGDEGNILVPYKLPVPTSLATLRNHWAGGQLQETLDERKFSWEDPT